MTKTRHLHDYDNFQDTLLDYNYTRYKAGILPGSGYDSKAEKLNQFFPGTRRSRCGSEEPPAPAPGTDAPNEL